MSKHVEFFAAAHDAAAAAAHRRGPARSVPTVSGAWFDADDAVVAWENHLTGRAGPATATLDEPRMVAGYVNDGSAVFEVPRGLVESLAHADAGRVRELAGAWSLDQVRDGNDLEFATALGLLTGLAELARDSLCAGRRLYCWVSG